LFVGPLAQLAEQLTLNQLVEGSSPSRLTGHFKGTQSLSRANWRGSSVPATGFPIESVRKNVEC
jgi:hypothetical protein